MMGHNMHFKGVIGKIIHKLSLLPLLIWSTVQCLLGPFGHSLVLFILVGVAKAFDEPVFPHPHLVQLCKEYFGTDDLKDPKLKMAMVCIMLCLYCKSICIGIDWYVQILHVHKEQFL